ncbi:MAG: DUF2179 domain-containing protein [Candidatus Omnitrophica bacterium]|nr:DUF2179 domain-containing protein [Candidatus Omnitrophota bacterium]
MDMANIASMDIYGVPLLPFFIFFARIFDVSIGTLRIIFVSRGLRYTAPILGFFEVIIWLLAVSHVVRNVNSPILIVSYGLGYATGNYIGMLIESRLRLGLVILRIITRKDATKIVKFLRSERHLVTKIEAEGLHGRVHVIFMVLKRKALANILKTLKEYHPHAYFSVEDVREVHEGLLSSNGNLKVINPMHRK